MTTRKPWPDDMAAAYHQILGAARRIAPLATGIIEYCLAIHNVYLARRWLVLINAKALEIRNARESIWRDRSTAERRRLPDWVLEALEMLGSYSREAVKESASAQRHLADDNWEALEIEVSRCLALSLLMEGYMLAGPPPDDGAADVLDQVRELIETLEEET